MQFDSESKGRPVFEIDDEVGHALEDCADGKPIEKGRRAKRFAVR